MKSRPLLGSLLLVLASVSAVFAGCSGGSTPLANATATAPTYTDAVHITRTTDVPRRDLQPLDIAETDAAKVQALYDGILALPAYFPGMEMCPVDSGVQYELTFTSGNTTVMQAIADPSGCQIVVLNGKDNRTANDNLWSLLASTVSKPTSDIYPIPTS